MIRSLAQPQPRRHEDHLRQAEAAKLSRTLGRKTAHSPADPPLQRGGPQSRQLTGLGGGCPEIAETVAHELGRWR
jgi:hypothetical protein